MGRLANDSGEVSVCIFVQAAKYKLCNFRDFTYARNALVFVLKAALRNLNKRDKIHANNSKLSLFLECY